MIIPNINGKIKNVPNHQSYNPFFHLHLPMNPPRPGAASRGARIPQQRLPRHEETQRQRQGQLQTERGLPSQRRGAVVVPTLNQKTTQKMMGF